MKALSLGAVIWDIVGSEEFLGGAPLNVVSNLARLGAESAIVTRIGCDGRAEKTLQQMDMLCVGRQFVQVDRLACTGIAKVILDEQNNACYEIPHAAFDEIQADFELIEKIKSFNPDVIYFGTLEQRQEKTRDAFKKILLSTKANYVFFDVNIRMDFLDKSVIEFGLFNSNILKINKTEYELISQLLFSKSLEMKDFCNKILKIYNTKIIVITLGDKGCYVCTQENDFEQKGFSFGLGDTIGAGDAFSAAFLFALSLGKSVYCAAMCGNFLGAYVASKRGALPEIEASVKQQIKDILDEVE